MRKIMLTLMASLSVFAMLAADVTPKPVIIAEGFDEYVEISAYGEGEVYLYIDGLEVENPCIYPCGEEEQIIYITAYAQAEGYEPSEMVSMQYTVLPLPPTPMPVIMVEDEQSYVVVSAVSEGEVNLYINGSAVDNPCEWPKSGWGDYLEITATAKIDGRPMSETAVMEYYIEPFPTMPEPLITYYETDDAVHILVGGEGYIILFVNDEPVEGNEYVIPRGYDEQIVVVYAVASAENYLPVETERLTIIVPALAVVPEQTCAPSMSYQIYDENPMKAVVEITPCEESMLYYRVKYYEDGEFTEWMEYDFPLTFTEPGYYLIESYAVADGKLPSYHCCLEFYLYEPTPPTPDYDFVVDGIYYMIIEGNKVGVVMNGGSPYGYVQYMGDIVIPNQVTYEGVTYDVVEIKDFAFSGCEGITSVTIGNYVTRIGQEAFYGCTGLTELILGDYVISVGDRAFIYCSSLSSVVIGHGVRNIGIDAFAGCYSLARVVCKPAVPPVMANRGCFDSYDTTNLIVYPAVLDSYQSANYWNQFSNIMSEDSVSPVTGDVDGDGIIGINDVTRLIDWILAR